MQKVKDVSHLRELIKSGVNSFFIQLNFGARSAKYIYLQSDDTFEVINDIDGTSQNINEDELFDVSITNIGKAINYGAFYAY